MIQITTLHYLHLWIEPIDFLKGLDALIGLCRQNIGAPYDGTIFAFRNKSGIAVKLLVYDGTGFWLCTKRFSQGKLNYWPSLSMSLFVRQQWPLSLIRAVLCNASFLSRERG